MSTEKFVTETGLKATLAKLYNWLPFKKKANGEVQFGQFNEDSSESVFSIGIGTEETPKNAFEVQSDGDIYIYDNSGKKVKLQNALETSGTGVDMTMSGYDDLIIANENDDPSAYNIKEDDTIKLAIKKLDKREESTVIEKTSYLNFPTIGKRGIIYRDTTAGVDYRWDSVNLKYYRVSAGIINGGTAVWEE